MGTLGVSRDSPQQRLAENVECATSRFDPRIGLNADPPQSHLDTPVRVTVMVRNGVLAGSFRGHYDLAAARSIQYTRPAPAVAEARWRSDMSIQPSQFDPAERRAASVLRDTWRFLLIEGIVLAVLGALAIIVPNVATLAVDILLGWLFLISGIVGLIMTFLMREAPGFWWSLFSAVLALAAGVALIGWPGSGVMSLTLLLIVFFILEGIATIMFALDHRREFTGRWGLVLASGVVDLVLAAIIFAGLPGTAAWAIGLLVGINMVFGGVALIMFALHAREIVA